jgi:hypothetical protein
MSSLTAPRDERTAAVDDASYRWAYLVLSFGLLISTAYRGFWLRESAWDLLALVVLGGLASTLYRARRGALPGQWALASIAAMGLALLLAAALALAAR